MAKQERERRNFNRNGNQAWYEELREQEKREDYWRQVTIGDIVSTMAHQRKMNAMHVANGADGVNETLFALAVQDVVQEIADASAKYKEETEQLISQGELDRLSGAVHYVTVDEYVAVNEVKKAMEQDLPITTSAAEQLFNMREAKLFAILSYGGELRVETGTIE